jgi:hypothetical protein
MRSSEFRVRDRQNADPVAISKVRRLLGKSNFYVDPKAVCEYRYTCNGP